jgi:hypothetical protein
MIKYRAVKNDTRNSVVAPYLYTDDQEFERIHSFLYLGSVANDDNISEEIWTWIENSNKYYCGLQKHFISWATQP